MGKAQIRENVSYLKTVMTTFGILTSGFESVTVNGQDRFGTFIIIIKVVKLRILMARMNITRRSKRNPKGWGEKSFILLTFS